MDVFLLLPNKTVMVHLPDVLTMLYNGYIYIYIYICKITLVSSDPVIWELSVFVRPHTWAQKMPMTAELLESSAKAHGLLCG